MRSNGIKPTKMKNVNKKNAHKSIPTQVMRYALRLMFSSTIRELTIRHSEATYSILYL